MVSNFFDTEDLVAPPSPATQKPTQSSFFDAEDIVQPVEVRQAEQPAELPPRAGGSFFDAEDIVARPSGGEPGGTPETVSPENAEYEKLRAEMDRGLTESIQNTPGTETKPITSEELGVIARKHGVSAEDLRDWMPFLLGSPGQKLEDFRASDFPKILAGTGGAMLGNIPQKLAKRAQSPEMERALDDVQELANRRLSWVGFGATMAGPGGALKKTAGVVPKLAAGAATGGAFGYGGSRQGHEAFGTLLGAGLGLGLAGVGASISRAIERRAARRAGEAAEAGAERVVRREAAGADFDEGLRREIADRSDADRIISEATFGELEQLSPAQTRTIVERYGQPDTIEKLTKVLGSEEAAYREIAEATIRRKQADMAADVVGRSVPISDSREVLRSWAGQAKASGQGVEYARQRMQDVLNGSTAAEYLERNGIAARKQQSVLGRVLDKLSDVQYVFRALDDKWRGLNLEDAHRELNRNYNLLTYAREKGAQALNRIYRKFEGRNEDRMAMNASDLISKYEAGGFDALNPAEQQVMAPFREYFERALPELDQYAETHGLPRLAIKSRPNYIPSVLAESGTLLNRIEDRMSALLRDAGVEDLAQLTPEQYTRVIRSNPEHRSTIAFLRTIAGEDTDNLGKLSLAYKDLFGPKRYERLETLAKASLEREDAIPMWARETNLYKLADRWTENSLRNLYLRRPMDRLRQKAQMLGNLRDVHAEKYVENLLADLSGIRSSTVAGMFSQAQQDFNRLMDRKIERATGSAQRHAYQFAKTVPSMLQAATRNVYSNLLGASPRALVQNLGQTLTKTVPEFGSGPYAQLLVVRGAARIGGPRGLRRYAQRLEQAGLTPEKFIPGGRNYLEEGLNRSKLARWARSTFGKSADIAMLPYQQIETANRAIAHSSAEVFGSDLLRGSSSAMRVLNQWSPAVRDTVQADLNAIPRLLQAGDREAAAATTRNMMRTLTEHVVNSTQYQYNRASMSEYGRTLGPLFSTFSKWPTATVGQVTEAWRTRGPKGFALDTTRRLLAPIAALELIDVALGEDPVPKFGEESDAEGLSDREKKLFGISGTSQMAPIGNLRGILTGDFFTPPAVDTGLRVLGALRSADEEKVQRGLERAVDNSVYMFAPGGLGGWVRFVTDDMVTLLEGERPEGSGFLERAGVLEAD